MDGSEKAEPIVKLMKGEPRYTPPGYEVRFSIAQAVQIAEFVNSPLFKMLKRVYKTQRIDTIARANLNNASNAEMLYYYKGMSAEAIMFFKILEDVKKQLDAVEGESKVKSKQFKK